MPLETEYIEGLKALIKEFMAWHNYGITAGEFFDLDSHKHIDALKKLRNCCIFKYSSAYEIETALRGLSEDSVNVTFEVVHKIEKISEDFEKYKNETLHD